MPMNVLQSAARRGVLASVGKSRSAHKRGCPSIFSSLHESDMTSKARFIRMNKARFSSSQSQSSESFWDFFWRENRRLLGFGIIAVAGVWLIKSTVTPTPRRVEMLIGQAQRAEDENEPAKATPLLRQALNHLQSSPFTEKAEVPVMILLADNLNRTGKQAESKRLYEEIVKMEPSTNLDMYAMDRFLDAQATALDHLGQLSDNKGNHRAALGYYVQSIAKFARDDPSVMDACWTAFEQGSREFQPLLKNTHRAKNLAGVLNNAGMSLLAQGREIEAKNLLLRCLAVATICVPEEDRDEDFTKAVYQVSEVLKDIDQ